MGIVWVGFFVGFLVGVQSSFIIIFIAPFLPLHAFIAV
jgi:hypothetical protein